MLTKIVVDVEAGTVSEINLTPEELAEIAARPVPPPPPPPTREELLAKLAALQAQIEALPE